MGSLRVRLLLITACIAVVSCTVTFDRDLIPEQTDSCLGTNPGTEYFRDDFDGTLDQWTATAGTWALSNSELEQQANMNSATIFSSFNANNDYRVVAQMRRVSGMAGGAMEILARAETPTDFYHCNWEPETGEFEIQDTIDSMPLVQRTITLSEIPNYSMDMPVIMEMQVLGNDIRCCLRDIPAATLNLSNSAYATGAPGLQTWFLAAAFDSVRVYGAR